MENNELMHHGVKGQRWGIIRTKEQLGHKTTSSSKSASSKSDSSKLSKRKRLRKNELKTAAPKKKKLSEMSEEEINKKIERMRLEKTYKQLTSELNPKKVSKGRQFVGRILSKSAENIGTQLATYVMGSAVNKIAYNFFTEDDKIVNPKKGQKDK